MGSPVCVVHSMVADVHGTWYTNVTARVLEGLFLVLALPLKPCGLEGVIPPPPPGSLAFSFPIYKVNFTNILYLIRLSR